MQIENEYGYLMHYAKGTESKNHQWVKRNWVDGKWQYVYPEDLAEMRAYQKHQETIKNQAGRPSYVTQAKVSPKENDLIKKSDDTRFGYGRHQETIKNQAGRPSYVTQDQGEDNPSEETLKNRQRMANAQKKYQLKAAAKKSLKNTWNNVTDTAELVKNWGVRTANRAKTWAVNTGNKAKDKAEDLYNNASYQVNKKVAQYTTKSNKNDEDEKKKRYTGSKAGMPSNYR